MGHRVLFLAWDYPFLLSALPEKSYERSQQRPRGEVYFRQRSRFAKFNRLDKIKRCSSTPACADQANIAWRENPLRAGNTSFIAPPTSVVVEAIQKRAPAIHHR